MFKYVELCVDLKKGRLAKDGLIQYRIACQQVNVQSLEEVVQKFLNLARNYLDRMDQDHLVRILVKILGLMHKS